MHRDRRELRPTKTKAEERGSRLPDIPMAIAQPWLEAAPEHIG